MYPKNLRMSVEQRMVEQQIGRPLAQRSGVRSPLRQPAIRLQRVLNRRAALILFHRSLRHPLEVLGNLMDQLMSEPADFFRRQVKTGSARHRVNPFFAFVVRGFYSFFVFSFFFPIISPSNKSFSFFVRR